MKLPQTLIERQCKDLGASLVMHAQCSEVNFLILAKRELENRTEHVTWQVKIIDGEVDFFWGHYFENLRDAKKDYFERIGSYAN